MPWRHSSLVGSQFEWSVQMGKLINSDNATCHRLAVSTIIQLKGEGIDPQTIADSLFAYTGWNPGERAIYLARWKLPEKLSAEKIIAVLDAIAERIARSQQEDRQNLNGSLTTIITRFVEKVSSPLQPTASRIWAWRRHLSVQNSYSESAQASIQRYFSDNDSIRREVQALAFADPSFGDTPCIAILHDLPHISPG